MTTIITPSGKSGIFDRLFYVLALLLLLISPVLGVIAAAVATWHALLAGSFWYMPAGLVLLLAAISMLQSHKLFDVAVLGLVVATVITWFTVGSPKQHYLLDRLQELTTQTHLMVGLLLAMSGALMLIRLARRSNRWSFRRHHRCRPANPVANSPDGQPGPSDAARVPGGAS